MSFETGIDSHFSQNSSDSDDFFDLDQPPRSYNCMLPRVSYPSQLFLTKSTPTKSDIDSGFDFTSSSSSGIPNSLAKFQYFETQKAISIQSTDLLTSEYLLDLNERSYECSQKPSNESNDSDGAASYSEKATNEQDSDEEMPLSGVSVDAGHNHEQQQSFTDVPDSILTEIEPIIKLFTQIKSQYSECAFVYALASNMCKDIYPKNSHISLKTALLLSIVSCNSQSNAQPISIMAITRDSSVLSSIMTQIGNFANRFICINDDLKFNGKCAKTKTIEANSLLLARNGVCFIGDWLGLKPTSLKYLQNVLDSGRVTADPLSNIEYSLKCAIWMYWSCSAKKMSQNQKDLTIISKLFGIPVVLDETPGQDVIEYLFSRCTTNQMNSQNDVSDEIDDNIIKTYLNFVSGIQSEFEKEALAMLKFYFIVTRSIRPNILTPKSFEILQRLSECHAKLCLRAEVLKIDVTFAIELFEQFVLNMFAGQVITKPIPNVSPSSYEQVDNNMHQFAEWLNEYLSNVNENVHTFFQENQ